MPFVDRQSKEGDECWESRHCQKPFVCDRDEHVCRKRDERQKLKRAQLKKLCTDRNIPIVYEIPYITKGRRMKNKHALLHCKYQKPRTDEENLHREELRAAYLRKHGYDKTPPFTPDASVSSEREPSEVFWAAIEEMERDRDRNRQRHAPSANARQLRNSNQRQTPVQQAESRKSNQTQPPVAHAKSLPPQAHQSNQTQIHVEHAGPSIWQQPSSTSVSTSVSTSASRSESPQQPIARPARPYDQARVNVLVKHGVPLAQAIIRAQTGYITQPSVAAPPSRMARKRKPRAQQKQGKSKTKESSKQTSREKANEKWEFDADEIEVNDVVIILAKKPDNTSLKLPNIDKRVWVIKVIEFEPYTIHGNYMYNKDQDIKKPLDIIQEHEDVTVEDFDIMGIYGADDNRHFKLTATNIKDIVNKVKERIEIDKELES